MKADLSQLTENFLYCKNEYLLNDQLGQCITKIYNAGVCDEKIIGMIQSRVNKHQYNLALNGKMPFKPAKLIKGDYVIGFDTGGKKIFSCIQYLNAHCLMIGGSGAGKITYSLFKILQIAPNIKGMLLFDMRKKEFRKLKSCLKRIGIDLIIMPVRSLRINPLQVPAGVTLSDWIPRISDTLVESLDLPPRASKLVQVKLFGLYQSFDCKANEFPTLFDLFESIKSDKSSNHQARAAILDNLEPVLLSLGPEVLGYRYGWSCDELAKYHIVFELAGCSEIDKNLILNTLILSEFISRVARGISNPVMDLLIFVDEAQKLCCDSSAIADLICLVRGTGIGLDLSLQSANGIMPQVISNTATKILGRCSFSDMNSSGACIGLNSEMIQWAQQNLEPGTFIARLGEGKCRHPFVFKIPKMNLSNSSQAININGNPLPNLKTTFANEFTGWANCGQVLSPNTHHNSSLFNNRQEYLFCKAVVDNPMLASSEYPKLAGISPNKAKGVRCELITKGYIKEHSIQTGAKGRGKILLEALASGMNAVNQYGGKP